MFFLVLFGAGTAFRASVFSDSVSLFSDATAKTSQSTLAPYLLGYAWEQRKNEPAARSAYEEVLRRNRLAIPPEKVTTALVRIREKGFLVAPTVRVDPAACPDDPDD